MDDSLIPYTHWAYFDDRRSAEACGIDLDGCFNCLTVVERSYDDTKWLLRAARTVSLDWPDGWHGEIKEVVECYGGFYDGGKSGWLDTTTGRFVEMAEGTEPPC